MTTRNTMEVSSSRMWNVAEHLTSMYKESWWGLKHIIHNLSTITYCLNWLPPQVSQDEKVKELIALIDDMHSKLSEVSDDVFRKRHESAEVEDIVRHIQDSIRKCYGINPRESE